MLIKRTSQRTPSTKSIKTVKTSKTIKSISQALPICAVTCAITMITGCDSTDSIVNEGMAQIEQENIQDINSLANIKNAQTGYNSQTELMTDMSQEQTGEQVNETINEQLGEWVDATNFASDTRTTSRDNQEGLQPIISKAPTTCSPASKLIKYGPDCTTVTSPDYYNDADSNTKTGYSTAFNNGATTWIDAQVFVPKHREGEKLPVILHSHGYGGSKLDELKEIPECDSSQQPYNCPLGELEGFDKFFGMFENTEKMLTDLVNQGYIVVSFSQRGFGKSEGDIMLMNPYHETQDAKTVLDWIAQKGKDGQLPIQVDQNNDFTIGLLGGSYGGGFQFPLSAMDTRIDTMIPIGTWHSLQESIIPNGVTKGGWGNLLCLSSIGKQQQAHLRKACLRMANTSIRTQDKLDPTNELIPFLNQSGLSYFKSLQASGLPMREGESPFVMRPVDTLLIQGMRDVLFNAGQAVSNYQYLKSTGADVRLLTNQSGHISPFANQNTSGTSNCGEIDIYRAMRMWLDVKLRGKPASLLEQIPNVCMSLDNDHALKLDTVPDTDNTPSVRSQFSLSVGNLRGPKVCQPVHQVETDNQVLAGRVSFDNLTVQDDTLVNAGVSYMGLCLIRDGQTRLIDDIVTGYPVGQYTNKHFMTVAEQLQKGDTIGVMAYKDHVQMFAFGPTAVPNFNALILQGFKPGHSGGATDYVNQTLPNEEWSSLGMFSINAFTAYGDISLPIMDSPQLSVIESVE